MPGKSTTKAENQPKTLGIQVLDHGWFKHIYIMHMVWCWGLSTDVFDAYICFDFRVFFMNFWTFLKIRDIFKNQIEELEDVWYEIAEWFWIKFKLREKFFYKTKQRLHKKAEVRHFTKMNFIWFYVWKIWSYTHEWYHEENCWNHAAFWLKIISQQTKPTSNKNTILVIFPRKEKQKYEKRYVFKRDIIQSTHQTSKYIRWKLIYDAKLCLRDV